MIRRLPTPRYLASRLGLLAPLAGLALFAAAGSVAAQESEAEALYGRYHQAAEVARLCRELTFDQADIDRMAAVINGKIGNDIGAKRLPLLTQAQRDGRALVEGEGCDSAGAQDLLALYDRDLAPVVD